jgi:putative restriction endonuclease
VDDYWHETGRSGFRIWHFRLVKLPDERRGKQSHSENPDTASAASRYETSVLRIVRDTRQARQIKELYDYRCQICEIRLEGLAGPYAEAAHIRPLGTPHHGPDSPDNILCLCPNHHVLFDHGGVMINDDLSLIDLKGHLKLHLRHSISKAHLRYRREHYQGIN